MGKIIVFNMMTLEGFFEGPNSGEIDWHTVDEEFNQFAFDQLKSAGGLLFGRITYELMASYWPTPAAIADDPVIAERMNTLPKVVFSRTLEKAEWNNSRIVSGNIVEELSSLKQQTGKDLFVFGSASFTATLIQHSLIDQFRIIVSPVILGRGNPLFKAVRAPLSLKLLQAKTFKNGNVLLYYEPIYD